MRLVASLDRILCTVTLLVHTICTNSRERKKQPTTYTSRGTIRQTSDFQNEVKRKKEGKKHSLNSTVTSQLVRKCAARRNVEMRIWIVIRIICQDSQMTAHCIIPLLNATYIDDHHLVLFVFVVGVVAAVDHRLRTIVCVCVCSRTLHILHGYFLRNAKSLFKLI